VRAFFKAKIRSQPFVLILWLIFDPVTVITPRT